MEITLEKIELVKERTGVTYKDAKDALERANGSVVDAIIDIEESAEYMAEDNAANGFKNSELFDKVKKTAEKGNMSRIVVKKGDEVLLNFPLTVSILGAVVAPWGVIFGAIAALGFKCKIEFINDKGQVTDVNGKVKKASGQAREKGGAAMDRIKMTDAYNEVRDRKTLAMDKLKDSDLYNNLREKSADTFADLKDKSADKIADLKDMNTDKIADKFADLKDKSADKIADLKDMNTDKIADKFADLKDKSQDTLDELKDKSADALEGIKEKSQETIENIRQTNIEEIKRASEELFKKKPVEEEVEAELDEVTPVIDIEDASDDVSKILAEVEQESGLLDEDIVDQI